MTMPTEPQQHDNVTSVPPAAVAPAPAPAPAPVAAQPVAPQPVAPQPVAPRPVAPRPEPVDEPEPAPEPIDEGLNLDTLEREGEVPEPFVFTLGGRRYELTDPNNLGWQTLLEVSSNPLRMIQALLPLEDQELFLVTPLPAWKLEALLEAYMKHYGLPPLETASDSRA